MGGSEALVVNEEGLDLTVLDIDAVFEGLRRGLVRSAVVVVVEEDSRIADCVVGMGERDSGQRDSSALRWEMVSSGHCLPLYLPE